MSVHTQLAKNGYVSVGFAGGDPFAALGDQVP